MKLIIDITPPSEELKKVIMQKNQIYIHRNIIYGIAICLFTANLFIIGCATTTTTPQSPIFNLIRNPCDNWTIDTTKPYIQEEISYRLEMVSGKLIVKNDVGSIYISKSPDENLHVRSKKFALSEADLQKIQLKASQVEEKQIEITVHYWNTSDSLIGFNQLEVLVPPTLSYLEIKTTAADIQIDELEADLGIFNSCGENYIHQIDGDMDFQGEYGNIIIDHGSGNIRISSTTGDIICETRIQPEKRYELFTKIGDIYFIPLDGGGKISVSTTIGSIDLGDQVIVEKKKTLSSLFDNAEMMGINEGIFLDHEKERLKTIGYTDNEIEGVLGAGSAKIDLETTNGNIYIK